MAAHRKLAEDKQQQNRHEEKLVGLPTAAQGTQENRVRKAGKRSDPAFRPTTIFVRKETQRKATRLLEDRDIGKDLSDLIEELLSEWLYKNSQP